MPRPGRWVASAFILRISVCGEVFRSQACVCFRGIKSMWRMTSVRLMAALASERTLGGGDLGSMSYLSLSQLKDVMHAPESCGIYLGRQGQQVLRQHNTGSCLKGNKCPSYPETVKPGWFKPIDLHLVASACPGQCLAKVSSHVHRIGTIHLRPSASHLQTFKSDKTDSLGLRSVCHLSLGFLIGAPTQDTQMRVDHGHQFTGAISPFEVHHALGDARWCVEGRQQFLTQLDGLHSEHLQRKVKGH